MKKLLFLFFLIVSLPLSLMADSHVHIWEPWGYVEGTGSHSSKCKECGETNNVKCYNATSTINDQRVNVCAYCGHYKEGTFHVLEATAKALNGKDSLQRGTFLVLGKEKPFSEDPTILYALIPGFTKDGAMATFKNKCRITVKLDASLPDSFHLIRVTPQSGDDSNQSPETWSEAEYSYENSTLTFETKSPYMYLIKAR